MKKSSLLSQSLSLQNPSSEQSALVGNVAALLSTGFAACCWVTSTPLPTNWQQDWIACKHAKYASPALLHSHWVTVTAEVPHPADNLCL